MAKEVKCVCGARMTREKKESTYTAYDYEDGRLVEVEKVSTYFKYTCPKCGYTFTADR